MEEDSDWRSTAIANIRNARSGNRRLGSRKSRTGCTTCKQRHLRCDEGRPSCQRCMDAQRICGYASISSSALTTSPGPSFQDSKLAFSLSSNETQLLQYFVNNVPEQIARSTTRFWQQELLQLCHHERFVLDAVLSFSILSRYPQFLQRFSSEYEEPTSRSHKLAQRKAGDPFGNVILNDNVALALLHFNRSISSLSQRLKQDIESKIYAALSCLIYTAIGLSRDHVFGALQMYLQGRKIIANYLAQMQEHALGQAVISEFQRLDLFAVSVDLQPMSRSNTTAEAFTSFESARSALANIMHNSQLYVKRAAWCVACIHHTGTNSQYALGPPSSIELGVVSTASTNDNQPDNVVSLIRRFAGYDESLQTLRIDPMDFGWNRDFYRNDAQLAVQSIHELTASERQIANSLGQWYDAFIEFTTTTAQNEATSRTSQLLMYYLASTIWLSTRLSPDQTVFDRYDHLFREILRHAKAYINIAGAQRNTFSLELGAVPPLYFVATKCRIPSLRRQALRLLTKTTGKECTFGAIGCAEIAAAVIRFEEADLDLPDPGNLSIESNQAILDETLPKEARRCHHFQVLQDDENLTYALALSYYISLLDGNRMQHEAIVEILPLETKHTAPPRQIHAYT
ncbi:hypothetical protein MRB53_041171 [Persea americana]|nr:hypothetical protein MRB53_041171 [Persea americana]